MSKHIIPIRYFNIHKMSFCFTKYNIKDFIIIYNLIEDLDDLNIWQKNLILTRFYHIYKYIKNYYIYICRCYSLSKLFIIVVGIINPALLSINHDQNNRYYVLIYWSVWILQLVVSIMTALISFFKWDKKYFLYTSYKTKIEQEIWLYLELTGKYAVIDFNNKEEFTINKTTHSTKINFFLSKIEGLYRKLKDSDLEIEDIDEDNNDNVSSNNEASQLYKNEIDKKDLNKNNDENYQQFILSNLKIILNDIKTNINEYNNTKTQYDNISNKLIEFKTNKTKILRKENNDEELNNINSEIDNLNTEYSNLEIKLNNFNINIKNIINGSEYKNIKQNISDEDLLICEIEQYFKDNHLNLEPYIDIFKN